MSNRPFKRLPGRGNGILNSATLWEADDHLLLVESHRVSESYKRFFYRDIQAFVLCETKAGLIISIILALIAVILGGLALVTGLELGISLGVVAGIFLLLALINHLRGPTCHCTLRTAVQTQSLPSLNRVKNAHKALLRIQPKITSAQAAPLS